MGLESSVSKSASSELLTETPADIAARVESAAFGNDSVGPDVIDNILSSSTDTFRIDHSDLKDETPNRRSPRPHPGNIDMPTLPMNIPSNRCVTADLSDLTFNSPSSQIVGTPFTTSGSPTRFEYPFPDGPSPQPDSSTSPLILATRPPLLGSTTLLPIMPHPHSHSPSPPPVGSSSFFALAHPPMGSQSRSTSLPAVAAQPRAGGTGEGYFSKLRAQANVDPPIPPSLSKKRLGWGMDLLSRRNAAGGPKSWASDKKVSDGQ